MHRPTTVQLKHETRGTYECSPETLDRMIATHLPASVAQLRAIAVDRNGNDMGYENVHTVTEFLVMFGEWEGDS
jgi:hypothetical protein